MSIEPVVAVGIDTPELYAWVATRRRHHRHVAGVLTEVARPQALSVVSDAVLEGLGKDPWLTVSKRPAELLAASWLLAGDATDVIVGYAQCLSPWLAPNVAEWSVGLGVTPWFLFSTFDDDPVARQRAEALAAAWGVELTGFDAVFDRWADTDDHVDPAPEPAVSFPRVPRVDGIRFRSTVHRLCDPDDVKVIDDLFTTTVTRMCDEVAAFGPKHRTRRFEALVVTHLDRCADVEEAVTVTRAAQVAGVRTGFRVDVDTLRLIGGLTGLPRTGTAVAQRWWEGLDRYRDPDPGAAAALYLAGVDPEVLPELRISDITLPATTGGPVEVVTANGAVNVDGPGVRFLVALTHLRLLAGAGTADRLFTTHRKDEVRTNHIVKLLWGTAVETGVEVASTPTHRKHPAARDWLTRHGVAVNSNQKRTS